jgi:hypothetical protein
MIPRQPGEPAAIRSQGLLQWARSFDPQRAASERPHAAQPSAIEDLEAARVKEVGCRISFEDFRACLNAAPTAVAGYF